MLHLLSMILLLLPGLAGLALAILADLGPLEGGGGLLSAPRLVLLTGSVLLLGWGGFVHFKAQRDEHALGRRYPTTVILLVVPTAFSIGVAVLLAEAAAGMLPGGDSTGLIFPPNSTATMRTSEFACTAHINELGIRDAAVSATKNGPRIMAIGDSFTYGWGVKDDQAWPEVLQRRLRQTLPATEVINLGAPGANPRDYALLARRAVRQLQPDLIVVAVVGGDDLAQLHYEMGKCNATPMQAVLEAALPNLFGRLDGLSAAGPRRITADALQAAWRAQAAGMPAGLGPEQLRRYRQLDPAVHQLFTDGRINPGLIQTAIERPDWFRFTLDCSSPAAQRAIANLASQLEAIREIGERWEAKTLVVALPLGPYNDARLLKSRRRLGFDVDPSMLDADGPDRAIQIACRQAGAPCFTCTDEFRRAALSEKLYYELDGHFTPEGQARFGRFVADVARRSANLGHSP